MAIVDKNWFLRASRKGGLLGHLVIDHTSCQDYEEHGVY